MNHAIIAQPASLFEIEQAAAQRLWAAASDDDAQAIREIVAAHPGLLERPDAEREMSALSFAVEAEAAAAVRALLELGANPLAVDGAKAQAPLTPLLRAASRKEADESAPIFQALCDSASADDIARAQGPGGDFLRAAAQTGRPASLRRIVDILSSREWAFRPELARMANSALTDAVMAQDPVSGAECVKILLPRSLPDFIRTTDGDGIVAICAKSGSAASLALLLEAGLDARSPNNFGITPLMHAAFHAGRPNSAGLLRALLPLSDASARSDAGDTALHFAALARLRKTEPTAQILANFLDLLAVAGDDALLVANKVGERPLDIIAQRQPPAVLSALLPRAPASRLTEKGPDGRDALDIALGELRWDNADLLLPAWPLAAAQQALELARRRAEPATLLPRAAARVEAELIAQEVSRASAEKQAGASPASRPKAQRL